MTCLEFRRFKMAEPRASGANVLKHAEECAACAQFTRQMDTLEERVASALEVPVPEGLADRLVLRSRTFGADGRRRVARVALVVAMAAAIIAVVGAWQTRTAGDPRDPFIAHVVQESATLTARDVRTEAELAGVFASFRGRLTQPIGVVRYVGQCRIGGADGKHVVVETPRGRATILLSREPSVATRTIATERGWTAVEVPLPGGGTMAIVAASRSGAEEEERRISSALSWEG